MGMKHKTILLKISGELIACGKNASSPYCSPDFPATLMAQIKELARDHAIGIVIGAGNFFRGSQDGPRVGLDPATAHEIGMIATIMNGRILQSWMEKAHIANTLLSMVPCPTIADEVRQHTIQSALRKQQVIIFAGGSGNPFFTTDTTAVVRALQIGATELWKATKVDGLFDRDPEQHSNATKLECVSYQEAISNNYGVMDRTALTLAQQHRLPLRIFNLFAQNALLSAARNATFGSTILPEDLL